MQSCLRSTLHNNSHSQNESPIIGTEQKVNVVHLAELPNCPIGNNKKKGVVTSFKVELNLLGYSTVQSVNNQRTFLRSMSPLSLLAACFILLSCLAYSSTLKVEGTRSSETAL
jgi:hypothetical protein